MKKISNKVKKDDGNDDVDDEELVEEVMRDEGKLKLWIFFVLDIFVFMDFLMFYDLIFVFDCFFLFNSILWVM